MNKEFIPYEEALELRELGFNEPCFGYYDNQIKELGTISSEVCERLCKHTTHTKAPTFSQAFRWFREKYNIDAWVQPFTSIKGNGKMYLPDESYSYFIFKDGVWVDDKVDFIDPEEAELACLKKLIQIIKDETNKD